MPSGPILTVPFYRNAHLAEHQKHHLLAVTDDLTSLGCDLVLVNDSPDDSALAARLGELRDALESAGVPVELVVNQENQGFVRSANQGLQRARDQGRPALLLNSDTAITPGALAEMVAVMGSDEKFGFVGPRSNNATLASLPWHLEDADEESPSTETDARRIMPYLDRWHIVPTVPGFCILIRWNVLDLVGLLDETFSPGYNEENDLVMRANRIGFVAVLANRAWVMHTSSTSFGAQAQVLEHQHAQILAKRYPEYFPAIRRYGLGEHRTFERMVAAVELSRRRPTVLVDLSFMRRAYNGTFEQARNVVSSMIASELWNESLKTSFLADRDILSFHGLGSVAKDYEIVELPPPGDAGKDTYAVRLLLAQPFSWEDTRRTWPLAAHHVVFFPDNIATDCVYIDDDDPTIRSLWRFMAAHAAAMAFPSSYSKEAFAARFPRRRDVHDAVVAHSLDPAEYRFAEIAGAEQLPCQEPFVLVIGNHYHHKRVAETVDLLGKRLARAHVVALGYQGRAGRNVHGLASGHLPEDVVAALYTHARLVVFPSNYEGFGLPLLRAVGNGARIVALDNAVAREIKDKLASTGADKQITLVPSSEEMVRLATAAAEGPRHPVETTLDATGQWRWADAAEAFRTMILGVAGDRDELDRTREAVRVLGYMDGAVNLAELTKLRFRVEDLESSTSWRYTAPLRKLSEKLRHLV